jgi:quinol monooxygenase YgiN
MPYIRISIMKPLAGSEPEVTEINEELVALYRQQEDCLQNYFMRAADRSGEVGRVSVWRSEEAAEQAATAERSMSLRSRLNVLVQAGHQERSFVAE